MKRPLPAPGELPLIINFRLNLSVILDTRIEENSQPEMTFLSKAKLVRMKWNLRNVATRQLIKRNECFTSAEFILKGHFYEYPC